MNGYIALVKRDADGVYRAFFPDLEGCRAEGRNVDEALAKARAALKSFAANRARHGESMPPPRPASEVATLSATHDAVGGACIHLRDISVRVRLQRQPRTRLASKKS
jgi:predicted RNase H-like HicB family nuclease